MIVIELEIVLNSLYYIKVASRVLKVNPDKIHIAETATDKVPNTSATAASAGSDLNGMAIMVITINNILLYVIIDI